MARWGAVPMVALLTGGFALAAGGQARADVDDLTFDAVTSAYGVEFRLTNPSIPTGIAIEGSGPTTGAKLNSLPQSSAFASLPYPGETGATITGPVKAISGLPVPDYPLFIQSANGSPPPQGGHFPGIDLTAKSTDNLSTSKAIAFTDAAGYVAESTVSQAKEGEVTALSTATQNGLQIGGTLTLSGVVSVARAFLDTNGKVTTSSNLTVTRFIAPALNITLPDEFNPPNSAPVPNPFKGQVLSSPDLSYTEGTFFVTIPGAGPQKYAVPDSAVADGFKALGIDMSFQQAVTSDNSVVAPTLVLKSVLPSPPGNQLYNGETPISYTIGRTSAAITGNVNAVDAPAATTSTAGTPAAAGATPAGGGAPVPVDGIAALPPAELGAVPSAGIPTVSLTPGGTVRGDQIVSTSRSGQDGQLESIAPFFFVLIGVGLIGLLAGQALQYVGVRSAWKS